MWMCDILNSSFWYLNTAKIDITFWYRLERLFCIYCKNSFHNYWQLQKIKIETDFCIDVSIHFIWNGEGNIPFVFKLYTPAFSPIVLTRGAEWPALPACAKTSHMTQALTDTFAPNTAHHRPPGAAKEIKIAHDQRMVKSRLPDPLSALAVMAYRWPVLEGSTATLNMSSRPKTHSWARPTHRTSWDTS